MFLNQGWIVCFSLSVVKRRAGGHVYFACQLALQTPDAYNSYQQRLFS
jgi:hypothetical protein